MATGPISRAEGSFRRPEGYRDYLESEAAGRASFLTSMDTFYAQLDEASRQFNETLGFKRETLEAEKEMFTTTEERLRDALAQNKAQFESELGLQRELGMGNLELGRESLDIQRGGLELGFAELETKTGMQANQFDWMREVTERTLGLKERGLEQQNLLFSNLIRSGPVGRGTSDSLDMTKGPGSAEIDLLRGYYRPPPREGLFGPSDVEYDDI